MLKVRLPDDTLLEFEPSQNLRPVDVAAKIGRRLARDTIAAEVDGRMVGADSLLPEEGEVRLRILTAKDPRSLDVLRHSCAHVMARAVMRLFPGVELGFGPTVDNGFYYDFRLEKPIGEDDFAKIEAEMAKIVAADEPFERIEQPHDKAVQICQDLGQKLKVEHLGEGLAAEQSVSFYRQGEFLDLCRGPHVPRAGVIGAFKLLSVAGAYWKGDASREQLQRIYGTAWFSQKDLDEHLARLEEAKRRDHRVLGKRLELFTVDPTVGSGLVLWLPKGAIIRRELEKFHLRRIGPAAAINRFTPQTSASVELYQTSGHFPYYADSQFPPIQMADGERYLLKPMNCPHHIKHLPVEAAELPRFAPCGWRSSAPSIASSSRASSTG